MKTPLRIGIAGLGTVGAGVLKVLETHADLLEMRSGQRIVVTAVSARSRSRDRGVDLSTVRWYEDAVALASDPDVDVVVELIGGSEGIARDLVVTALENGKHVVTANKALLAHHGNELAALAERRVSPLPWKRLLPAAFRSSRACARDLPPTRSRKSTAS